MATRSITVTGAAGKTGRAIVGQLARHGAAAHEAGRPQFGAQDGVQPPAPIRVPARAPIRAPIQAPIRALVRLEDRRTALLAAGADEVALGDLMDRDSLERAVRGSAAVYHICPNMHPDEEEIGARVIEACKSVGVERLVYHSVLHPQIEAMPHHWRKLRVEERLIESGLDFTILQPAAYMQNIRPQWNEIVRHGVYEVPYAAETRLAMVDLQDVAEAAARVLTEDGHSSAVYELCGPGVMDQRAVADVLAQSCSRDVKVAIIDRDEWARGARAAGLGEYAVSSLLSMFEHYERHGFSGNPRVLESLLGRPATSLAEVVGRWAVNDDESRS